MPQVSHGRGIRFAVGAASIYGLVPNVARLAFIQGVPALESVVVRTATVALLLGALAIYWRQGFQVPRPARAGLTLQVLATILVSSCYIAAVQFIPVGVAVLVFFTFPVMIALAAPLVERRSPAPLKVFLALLAFAGLGVALGPAWQGLDGFGLLLAALAALGCALQFFSGRMVAGHISPAPLAAMVHAAVLPFVLAFMLATGHGHVQLLSGGVNGVAIGAVLLVGLSYCAAYFMQMSSVANAPASTVAPYFNIEPVVTTVVAMLLLGEKLTMLHVTGGAMILIAIVATGLLGPDNKAQQQGPTTGPNNIG